MITSIRPTSITGGDIGVLFAIGELLRRISAGAHQYLSDVAVPNRRGKRSTSCERWQPIEPKPLYDDVRQYLERAVQSPIQLAMATAWCWKLHHAYRKVGNVFWFACTDIINGEITLAITSCNVVGMGPWMTRADGSEGFCRNDDQKTHHRYGRHLIGP